MCLYELLPWRKPPAVWCQWVLLSISALDVKKILQRSIFPRHVGRMTMSDCLQSFSGNNTVLINCKGNITMQISELPKDNESVTGKLYQCCSSCLTMLLNYSQLSKDDSTSPCIKPLRTRPIFTKLSPGQTDFQGLWCSLCASHSIITGVSLKWEHHCQIYSLIFLHLVSASHHSCLNQSFACRLIFPPWFQILFTGSLLWD